MAVNSKADKTHGHKVSRLPIPGIHAGSLTAPTPFSSAKAPPPGAGGPIAPAGAKALGIRAKSVLKPLADPSEAP